MAPIPWQQKVARWTNGSEAGRIIACLDRELQSTIRRYASFQETPSLHAKGSLGYLNSMYFSILYKMHMGRKHILRGFSVFSRPMFLICVLLCDLLGLLCDWLRRRVGLDRVCLESGGRFVGEMGLYPVKLASLPFLFLYNIGFSCCMSSRMDRSLNVFFVCSLFVLCFRWSLSVS